MISKHFSEDELACRCGCGQMIVDVPLIGILEGIRARFLRPITVYSGNRCPAHNADCGGVGDSQHLYGKAADISVSGIDLDSIARAAEQVGADGIGIYRGQGFVHVDSRGEMARWEG
jgi:uncharacterized protein YcbK (DUF882 family)